MLEFWHGATRGKTYRDRRNSGSQHHPEGRRRTHGEGVYPGAEPRPRQRSALARLKALLCNAPEIRLAKRLLLPRPRAACDRYWRNTAKREYLCAGITATAVPQQQAARAGENQSL